MEVLRSSTKLSNGEYVASTTGFVTTLATAYNPAPDSQEVTLNSPLPAEYSSNPTSPLFLRVWQEEKPFKSDEPVSLGETGLQVTLSTSGNQPFHVGDYWMFAVRPTTATEVYPHRYEKPQQPDGPRLWACPLAVFGRRDRIIKVLEDCRQPFDSLVELTKRKFGGGCCTVTVRPEDLKGNNTLQSILDLLKNKESATVCFMPGNYQLSQPLVLGPEHSYLTLEGCHDGVVLEAAPGSEKYFLHGLVVLNRANNITLRRLRFHLPQVPFFEAGGLLAGLKGDWTAKYLERSKGLLVSIGVRPLHCAVLTVEDCLFRYSLTKDFDVFGVGLFAGSECWGLKVQNCRFIQEEEYLRGFQKPESQEPLRILTGYLLAPSLSLKALPGDDRNREVNQPPAGTMVRSLLQDATFSHNLFAGLTFATLIMADTGVVKIENNTVRECYSGFWLMTLRALLCGEKELREIGERNDSNTADDVIKIILQVIQERVTYLAIMLSQSYPLPVAFVPRDAVQVPKADIRISTELRLVEPLRTQVNSMFNHTFEGIPLETGNTVTGIASLELSTLATKETIGFAKLLGDRLEDLKRAGLQKLDEPPLQLSLDFSQNAVDVLLKDALSGTSLFVWGSDPQTQSMMTMSGNRLRNKTVQVPSDTSSQNLVPTVVIIYVDRCTVTGNLVLNESVYKSQNTFVSILLLPGYVPKELLGQFGPPVAITGNVFKGLPFLPDRPDTGALPGPLRVWVPTFNTFTW